MLFWPVFVLSMLHLPTYHSSNTAAQVQDLVPDPRKDKTLGVTFFHLYHHRCNQGQP